MSAKQIAYFIKYLYKESLGLTFQQFSRQNQNEELYWAVGLDALLRDAAQLFRQPVIPSAQLQSLCTEAGAADKIIEGLIDKQDLTGLSEDDKAKAILAEITGRWMRVMKTKMNIPMCPHHTQAITMLLCHEFFCKRSRCEMIADRDSSDLQTLICEVGTGEGKSLIIAMVAIYFVKAHGKRVHILVNNKGLLERDFSSMEPFFGWKDQSSRCCSD